MGERTLVIDVAKCLFSLRVQRLLRKIAWLIEILDTCSESWGRNDSEQSVEG
ncbi:MAG: hypothetical protein ACI9JM_001807 [Halioglobus sp.]|jgi:hypothetical protein